MKKKKQKGSPVKRIRVIKKPKYDSQVEKSLYESGSAYLNQFFTPPDVAEFMARIAHIKPRHHVLDIAMGTGALLYFAKPYSKHLYGVEINQETLIRAKKVLGHGNFIQGNALTETPFPQNSFDKILLNSPFGRVQEKTKPFELRSKRMESLFIEDAYKYLKYNGVLVAIVPEGLLVNSSMKSVRDWILNHYRLVSVISLPQKLFFHSQRRTKASPRRRPSTTTKTSIIVLQKQPLQALQRLKKTGKYGVLFAIIDEKDRQAQFDKLWEKNNIEFTF